MTLSTERDREDAGVRLFLDARAGGRTRATRDGQLKTAFSHAGLGRACSVILGKRHK